MSIRLIKPEHGAVIRLLPDGQIALRGGERVDGAAGDLDWRSPTLDGTERSYPLPVKFEWSQDDMPGEALLLISESDAFEDARAVVCGGCEAEVWNLRIGQKYYWKVTVGGETSEVRSFETESMAPRLLRVPGITNVRDVGGWTTVEKWRW